uniref:Nudix hydrolase domain-containing protein n=1 Tax=Rhabditophanes sp. KR3021 TaxID=114890 RepID=A0AC35TVZ7_9BILA
MSQQPIVATKHTFKCYDEALQFVCFRYIDFELELQKYERVMFNVEQAYWYYLDFLVPANPSLLLHNSFAQFAYDIIRHSENLQHLVGKEDEALAAFKEYKSKIATCGAILVDPSLDYCLLVQMYANKSSFGFPKGKINYLENPEDCAIRETQEETGYNCRDNIHPDIFYDHYFNGALCRLYLVTNVDTNFSFKPNARHEICKIQWFLISQLPSTKDEVTELHVKAKNLYTVVPFVKRLKDTIKELRNPLKVTKPIHQLKHSSDKGNGSGKVQIKPSQTSAFNVVKDGQKQVTREKSFKKETQKPVAGEKSFKKETVKDDGKKRGTVNDLFNIKDNTATSSRTGNLPAELPSTFTGLSFLEHLTGANK